MLFDIGYLYSFCAEAALDSEGIYYFFDHARSTSNFDVFVAHGAIFVENEPVLNANAAE
jgi:hypothetical protein